MEVVQEYLDFLSDGALFANDASIRSNGFADSTWIFTKITGTQTYSFQME